MSAADFNPDPFFSTPDGVVLNKLARNPHFNVDVVHGSSGGQPPTTPVSLGLSIPEILNGQSYIETLTPPISPDTQYTASLSGEYDNEPLVLVNVERISPTSFRLEIQNQSGVTVATRSVTITFS